MSVRSAAGPWGWIAVGVREASWWLRALAGAPVAFPRVSLPTGLLLLAATLAGYPHEAFLGLLVLLGVGIAFAGWRRYAPVSFARLVRDPWWRRRVARWLRRSWPELMAGCGLARGPHAHQEVPELRRAWWQAGELHAVPVLLVGQTVDEFAAAQERLRVALEAARVRVIATKQATACEVVWSFTDIFATAFEQTPPPVRPSSLEPVDLDRVALGRAEDGSTWWLNVRVSTLVGGSTGAGKGSVMWGLLVGLAPAIHAGTVRVHGVDLKGGMELALGGPLFTSWATTPADAVALLEDVVVECQSRARALAGRARTHTPSSAEPLVLIVIDELASLLAYLPERDLLRRAEQALGVLLSTGRAPGFYVFAFLQDPRKEVVRMRSLFTQAIALRLRDKEEVTMLLGDGAVTAGALCHKIPASMPGVGFVVAEDGRPQRVRAGYVPDELIRQVARQYPAPGTPTGLPVLESAAADAREVG